jgi:hypothetical protein
MVVRTLAITVVGLSVAGSPESARTRFSDSERARALTYWAEPTRYHVSSPPEAAKEGPWQVRLTVEGSTWLWNYNRARNLPKVPPGEVPPPLTAEQQGWEKWIDAKVAWDRRQAAIAAAEANARALSRPMKPPAGATPAMPGPIPEGLLELAGNPPPFAAAVAPLQHSIRFDDGTTLTYNDNTPMRERYAFYRFSQGVMSGGQAVRNMPAAELNKLFKEAGVSDSEQRVMKAVSLLEGGFDSVNTYDTGFVSVGFIQFACLRDGGGSLAATLLRMKRDNPRAFDEDFRRFGLDVTDENQLVALDLVTGAELIGAAAAHKIIEDKRLIAVFQRAGRVSRPFRIAQIQVAKEQYYPGPDAVLIELPDRKLSGRVADIIKSESGMATLMDRKVNTGKIDPFLEVVSDIAQTHDIKKFQDLARFERDIIAALKYRKDYLVDNSLKHPGPLADPQRSFHPASRKGTRNDRNSTPPPNRGRGSE